MGGRSTRFEDKTKGVSWMHTLSVGVYLAGISYALSLYAVVLLYPACYFGSFWMAGFLVFCWREFSVVLKGWKIMLASFLTITSEGRNQS